MLPSVKSGSYIVTSCRSCRNEIFMIIMPFFYISLDIFIFLVYLLITSFCGNTQLSCKGLWKLYVVGSTLPCL